MSSFLDFIKPMKNNVSYVDYLKNPERKYKQKKERLPKSKTENKESEKSVNSEKKSKNKVVVNINLGGSFPNNKLISKLPGNVPIHQGANNLSFSDVSDLQKQLRSQIRAFQHEMNNNRYRDNTNLQTEIDFLKKQGNDVFTVLQKVQQTGDINKSLNELIAIQSRKYDRAGRPTQEVKDEITLATTDARTNLSMQDPASLALKGF